MTRGIDIIELVKAGTCATVAGATVLTGTALPAHAYGSQVDFEHVRVSESSRPSSLEDARAALDAANQVMTSSAVNQANAHDALEAAKSEHASAVTRSEQASRDLDAARATASASAREKASDLQDVIDSTSVAIASARTTYDDALAKKQEALRQRIRLEQELEELSRSYESEVAAHEADALEASARLEAAKENLERAELDCASVGSNLDAVRSELAKKTDERIEAAKRLEDARNARAEKEAQLESAHVVLAQAKDDLDHAGDENQLEEKTARLEAAKLSLAQKKSELEAAESALASAQAAQSEAESLENDAKEAYESARICAGSYDIAAFETAVANAQSEYDSALADRNAKQTELLEAQRAAATIVAQMQQAQADLDVAKEAAAVAEEEFEAAAKELAEAQEMTLTLRDYFTEMYEGVEFDDDAYIEKYLVEDEFNRRDSNNAVLEEVVSATHYGAAGDASNYQNVLKALETIDDLNAVRRDLGLGELKITNQLMARSTVSVNWSAKNVAHSTGCGGENLAFDWEYPVTGWYNYEKSIYDAAARTNTYNGRPLPENWQSMTTTELKAAAPDFWHAVGHYYNVINPNYHFIGAAFNNEEGNQYGFCYGQSYSYFTQCRKAYSVEEWRSQFLDWVNRKLLSADNPKLQAQNAYAVAKSVLDGKRAVVDKLMKDCQDLADAQSALDSKVVALSGELAERDDAIVSKGAALDNARSECDRIRKDHEAAVAEAGRLEELWQQAQCVRATKEANRDELLASVSGLAEELSAIQRECDVLSAAIDAANQERSDAEQAWTEAQESVDGLESQVEAIRALVEELEVLDAGLGVEEALLLDRVSECEEELSAAEQALAQAREDLHSAQLGAGDDREMIDHLRDLAAQVAQAREDLFDVESHVGELEAALEDAKRAMDSHQAVLKSAMSAHDAISGIDADDLMSLDLDANGLESLWGPVNDLRIAHAKVADAKSELAVAQNKLAQTQVDNEKAQSAYVEAASNVVAAQLAYDELLTSSSADAEPGSDPTPGISSSASSIEDAVIDQAQAMPAVSYRNALSLVPEYSYAPVDESFAAAMKPEETITDSTVPMAAEDSRIEVKDDDASAGMAVALGIAALGAAGAFRRRRAKRMNEQGD